METSPLDVSLPRLTAQLLFKPPIVQRQQTLDRSPIHSRNTYHRTKSRLRKYEWTGTSYNNLELTVLTSAPLTLLSNTKTTSFETVALTHESFMNHKKVINPHVILSLYIYISVR